MTSKLTPYQEDIFRWKTEGKTWREIAALLAEQHGLKVHHSIVHRYMERLRKRILKNREWREPFDAAGFAATPSRSDTSQSLPALTAATSLRSDAPQKHHPPAPLSPPIARATGKISVAEIKRKAKPRSAKSLDAWDALSDDESQYRLKK